MFVKKEEDEDQIRLIEFWSLILELLTLYSQLELLTDEVSGNLTFFPSSIC